MFAASFCNEKGDTCFVRTDVDPMTRQPKWTRHQVRMFQQFFSDTRRQFGFWNAHFDVRHYEAIGVRVPHDHVHDIMYMAHCIHSDEPTFALKPMAQKYVDYPADDQIALQKIVLTARRKAKAQGWNLDPAVVADYWLPDASEACETYAIGDAERTMLLWLLAEPELDKRQVRGIYDMERELWTITYEMITRGVRFDPEQNNQLIKQWKKRQVETLALVHQIAGTRPSQFDPDKPAQVQKILYDKLGIPINRRTFKRNDPATDVKVLKNLVHPIGHAILEYRACGKALSTYFERYARIAVQDSQTGLWVLHPDFQQMGPRTGRFSCRNPNLQNAANDQGTRSPVPIQARTPMGPRPGYCWYSIDYAQIEVRVFADVAKEEKLRKALLAGQDVHGTVAQECWPEEYHANVLAGGKNVRNRAKLMVFGKIYGIGKATVAELLETTIENAAAYIKELDTRFPRIPNYMRELSSQAKRDGEIRTRYGRRIPVDFDFAYRAVNYMVQGTSADVLKWAMIATQKYLRKQGVDAHLVMTIHDELVFEWNRTHAYKHLIRGVQERMSDHGGRLGIDLPTDVSRIDYSWEHKVAIKMKGEK
jgi:DNA polymerase I-like protein with 3'-5' exonuclease and polymerase domains